MISGVLDETGADVLGLLDVETAGAPRRLAPMRTTMHAEGIVLAAAAQAGVRIDAVTPRSIRDATGVLKIKTAEAAQQVCLEVFSADAIGEEAVPLACSLMVLRGRSKSS